MNLLGSVGQLYMFVLLVLLFLGSGFALWRFINFLMERRIIKSRPGKRSEATNGQVKSQNKKNINGKVKGGFAMANNGWLKLAVFSFVGIIVSVAVLGLVSAGNSQGVNMWGQGTGIHQQHQQQNSMAGMNMQGGMNVNTPMGNMQMQGNMNGGMDQNQMMMQQINQMQMQLNQMQQQMGMMNGGMNGNMQMQQGNMNNMQQSGNSMSGGGMGMMGGMGNMQQSNGSMQQSSGGGMGMM